MKHRSERKTRRRRTADQQKQEKQEEEEEEETLASRQHGHVALDLSRPAATRRCRVAALIVVVAAALLLACVCCDEHHQRPRSTAAKVKRNEFGIIFNKVDAFASQLERWLTCHRLSARGDKLAPAGGQSANGSQSGACAPYFDGHVCWPATAAGQQAKVLCPKQTADAANQSEPGEPTEPINWAPPSQPGDQAAAELMVFRLKELKFARRNCELPQEASAAAQWAASANFADCQEEEQAADRWLNLDEPQDRRLFELLAEQLERLDSNMNPYGDSEMLDQWTSCISRIVAASQSAGQQTSAPHAANESRYCPIIFDGWRCWPETRAGETAYVSCPGNQPGFSAERKAHKICTRAADWYRHPLTDRYWSNYTTCVDTQDLAFRTKILNLYVIGNSISLIALAASLIIFISFKSLNCTRVIIHKNLFLSFITNNLMWIIWYTYVVNDADLLQSNPIECRLWHILLHYFLVSNYFWMFCEGLYLHTLLVVAFVSEDKILKWFYLLGWLTPLPIIIGYAYSRSFDYLYTNFCWMEESPHNVIITIPIGISLLLNLIFLINIVRVLVTKLRANNSPDAHQTRKAVRATLILIPLLGLHYMLTPFRPEAKSEWEVIYEIIAAVCTSFQGLCVAMLFCFCNGEVTSAVQKKLKDTFGWKTSQHHYNGNRHHHHHLAATKSTGDQIHARGSLGAGKWRRLELASCCGLFASFSSSSPPPPPLPPPTTAADDDNENGNLATSPNATNEWLMRSRGSHATTTTTICVQTTPNLAPSPTIGDGANLFSFNKQPAAAPLCADDVESGSHQATDLIGDARAAAAAAQHSNRAPNPEAPESQLAATGNKVILAVDLNDGTTKEVKSQTNERDEEEEEEDEEEDEKSTRPLVERRRRPESRNGLARPDKDKLDAKKQEAEETLNLLPITNCDTRNPVASHSSC